MKFKLVYLYILIILSTIGGIYLYNVMSNDTGSDSEQMADRMPADSVHKKFVNPHGNINPEHEKRLKVFRDAYEKSPEDTLLIREYADYLNASHQFDEAIPLYEKILKKNEKRTDIYFAITYALYSSRKFDEAETITKKVLGYDPMNLQAQYNMGALAIAKGNKDKAKEYWTALKTKYPETEAGKMASQQLERL